MFRTTMAALAGAFLFAGAAHADAVLNASQTAAVTAEDPNNPSPGGIDNGGFLTVNYATGDDNYGLLQFDLSGVTGSASAAAVLLHHVFNTLDPGQTADFALFRVTSAWDASTVTFNTAPTYDATPVSMKQLSSLNGPDELEAFDVTGVVNGWLGGSYANYGLLFRRTDAQNPFLYFAASSDGGRVPVLSIISNSSTAPVPEPATWALMIGGFGMAGVALRRSRRRVAA